jgi:hypothetical protein
LKVVKSQCASAASIQWSRRPGARERTEGDRMDAVTVSGVWAATFMMVTYAVEGRGRGFVLAFAAGCLHQSA